MCEFDVTKQIPNWPGYLATPCGQILDSFDGHVLHQSLTSPGQYPTVTLIRDDKRYSQYVHRLILETYVGPCPDGMECRHLDGNPKINDLKNLMWGTHRQNTQDMVRHGKCHLAAENRKPGITYGCEGKYGEDHPQSKLSNHERRLIHSKYRDGDCTQQELADEFSIGVATIGRIVNDNRWRSDR